VLVATATPRRGLPNSSVLQLSAQSGCLTNLHSRYYY